MSLYQTNSENVVFGVRISVKSVRDHVVVFPRRKKRPIALIEFEFAQQTLQFGFHRPVLGRQEIIPLIQNFELEYEVDDPKKIVLTITSKFGIPPHYSHVILWIAKLMAGNAIDRFHSDRQAATLFGGGPVEFRDQGRPGPAEDADQPQP